MMEFYKVTNKAFKLGTFLTASIALAVLGITLMMMMMMTRTFFEISLKINKSVKRITLMMMMTQNFF